MSLTAERASRTSGDHLPPCWWQEADRAFLQNASIARSSVARNVAMTEAAEFLVGAVMKAIEHIDRA
ncbi:hypothetical protein AB8Z38_19815 [Bradyrhizobium sp. LLZ17]|jgi:hypothetical protein|uniref:Uncharacterized protein n=1 Tax=Bradyrhizobium sp. LLZ17 TaxID=3239388 RepID=A0AB39XDM9_9BRAD